MSWKRKSFKIAVDPRFAKPAFNNTRKGFVKRVGDIDLIGVAVEFDLQFKKFGDPVVQFTVSHLPTGFKAFTSVNFDIAMRCGESLSMIDWSSCVRKGDSVTWVDALAEAAKKIVNEHQSMEAERSNLLALSF